MSVKTRMSRFTAIVLAGDRAPGDVVAVAAGVAGKCLTPVAGTPMVIRVLDALDASDEIGDCILCGPPRPIVDGSSDLLARLDRPGVGWVANQSTPSTSALAVLKSLPPDGPVLVTTADHALLSPEMVDHFCRSARESGCDLAAALASHETIMAAYPGMRRTVTRLKDGAYCSCNLFAFMTPRAREAANFWRRVESQRKKPLRVVAVLGVMVVLRYLFGILTLDEALARLSRRLGMDIGAVKMPFAEAAVDVDTLADWKLVDDIASGKYADAANR